MVFSQVYVVHTGGNIMGAFRLFKFMPIIAAHRKIRKICIAYWRGDTSVVLFDKPTELFSTGNSCKTVRGDYKYECIYINPVKII